jgi:hypothetical protein
MSDITVSEMKGSSSRQGAITIALSAGLDLGDSVTNGAFSVAKTARAEAFAATAAAVDWLEMLPRSGFKIVREVVARLDSSSQAALDGCEALARALSRAVRDSGTTATELLSRTSSSLVGDDGSRRAA